MRTGEAADGIEAAEAWFGGAPFHRHRHDTYAIGTTVDGVKTFTYRGERHRSVAGQVIVLSPDEPHDGAAASDVGFGYRILYVEPAKIADAVLALTGRAGPLPFARPVSKNQLLRAAITAACNSGLEPLARDALLLDLARGLLQELEGEHARSEAPVRLDRPALDRVRQFLDAECRRVVRSDELEAISGLSRFQLARQFRALFGSSPYRYLQMRRLDAARRGLSGGTDSLADIAYESGFADQAHFTRTFKSAYGITPARYRAYLSA